MEDREIVALFLKRDENAIKESQKKYGKRLLQLAEGITGSSLDAAECENDAYLSAWNEIPPAEPYEYLYPFLARIVRCLALNMCRDRERHKRKADYVALTDELAEVLPGRGSTEESVDEKLLSDAINRFLAKQKETQRIWFVRRYWFFDSIGTIAANYNVGESKVKVTLMRMRAALGEYLKHEGFM